MIHFLLNDLHVIEFLDREFDSGYWNIKMCTFIFNSFVILNQINLIEINQTICVIKIQNLFKTNNLRNSVNIFRCLKNIIRKSTMYVPIYAPIRMKNTFKNKL